MQLHDTYVADLTFRYPGTVPVAELTHLNPEGMLLPDRISASIGQTLVLFAKPVIAEESPSPDTLRQLADRCLQALLTNAPLPVLPSYRAEGKLLGSPIFEYDNDAENPAQSCHILIWLDCHPDTTQLEDIWRLLSPPDGFALLSQQNPFQLSPSPDSLSRLSSTLYRVRNPDEGVTNLAGRYG